MKTTERGILEIKTDESYRKSVIFSPVNGTVWLRKCELIELFGVYRQTIDACIQGICKSNMFDMEEVCKCNCIVKVSKIEYEPYEFSFEFIIAMAFRINSLNAEILRQWVLNQLISSKSMVLEILTIDNQNYNWNY